MTLPNFLVIGAAKSGTSSLYMYLKQHPQIFMSPIKEPHFFSFDSISKNTKGPGDTIPQAITDITEYSKLFDKAKDELAIGEASPTYLYREEAAERIFNLIPSVKLIAILRNPAERAFSAYMHVIRDGREKFNNFSDAMAQEELRINDNWGPIWHYTKGGFYYEQLSRYYNLFPSKQIKVFLYEDLINNQQNLLKNIFDFLNIDSDFIPDSSIRYNISGTHKNVLIHSLSHALFNSPNPIRWLSRKFLPESLRWKMTSWVRDKNIQRHKIPKKTKLELIKLFSDDVNNLEKLINRDLSHWLE